MKKLFIIILLSLLLIVIGCTTTKTICADYPKVYQSASYFYDNQNRTSKINTVWELKGDLKVKDCYSVSENRICKYMNSNGENDTKVCKIGEVCKTFYEDKKIVPYCVDG